MKILIQLLRVFFFSKDESSSNEFSITSSDEDKENKNETEENDGVF